MSDPTHTIAYLMKVSLNIRTGTTPADHTPGTPFEFIYGIGPGGITPFEKALFGKGIGEQAQFDLSSADYAETVGHLAHPLCEQAGIMPPVSMRITIANIVRAQDHEVVKAMAAGDGCGDCGCGCGGH